MARFKYMGERTRPGLVSSYGPTKQIVIPKKDGSKIKVDAPTPAGFQVGDEVGFDFTDVKSLEVLRADPRFEEI